MRGIFRNWRKTPASETGPKILSTQKSALYKEHQTEEWITQLLKVDPAAIILHGRTQRMQAEGDASWEEIKKAVEVKNLVRSYGAVQALKGVSFSVEEGEIFGLIGPDGAGKTTLFRILTTLLLADQGENERGVELYALASRYPFVAKSRWFEDVVGQQIGPTAGDRYR